MSKVICSVILGEAESLHFGHRPTLEASAFAIRGFDLAEYSSLLRVVDAGAVASTAIFGVAALYVGQEHDNHVLEESGNLIKFGDTVGAIITCVGILMILIIQLLNML